jgi:hypothetical protein
VRLNARKEEGMTDMQRQPITLKRLAYELEGMRTVLVRRDIPYRDSPAGALTMDVYSPPDADDSLPVVLIVAGYRDVGAPNPLGCAFKDMEMSVSLAQLLAVSGMAAVTYRTSDPAVDGWEAIQFLARNAAGLRIAANRIGLWASSGNVPVALSLLMRHDPAIRAAVLSDGFTLDTPPDTAVADAARTYGFVNASAGRSVGDLPESVPLFVVRSGRDEFEGLNGALDRFLCAAVERNLAVTFVNYRDAAHAFELNDPRDSTRHVIAQMLAFMSFQLRANADVRP